MLKYRNLTIIPTYHSNIDFAQQVRLAFFRDPPEVIAVELPKPLEKMVIKGVKRLPAISIIVYYDPFLDTQLYVPIEGSDSLIEAVRLGLEYGIPVEFIDLFVKNYSPIQEPLPDSNALDQIPLKDFYSLIISGLGIKERAEYYFNKYLYKKKYTEKKMREEADQFESQSSIKKNTGSDAMNWLKDPWEIDLMREQYMATHIHELIRSGKKVLLVIGLKHWELVKKFIKHGEFWEDYLGFEPDVDVNLYNVKEQDLHHIMLETPNIVYRWEQFRNTQKEKLDDDVFEGRINKEIVKEKFDKFGIFNEIKDIIIKSIKRYEQEYAEKISIPIVRGLFKYLRNLPLVEGMIRPQMFEIVLAAKGMVNDDFAWIVWEECTKYPDAIEPYKSELETLNFTDRGIFLNGKYFKIRRSIPVKIRKIKLPLKPKPKERRKGEWREIWENGKYNLVSHIPEDIFEENYFNYIRRRSQEILTNYYSRTVPFKASLLDGIDFRETIRRWIISDRKIYVKENLPFRAAVDAVVIIFDEDNGPVEKYPHKMMWYAEHHNESDLALYSTPPGKDLVGPGISRIKIGGLATFFPPRGMPDIWSPRFLRDRPYIKYKFHRLLIAAIIYSQEKYITYIAKHPPPEFYKNFARRVGNEILYIPLDRFNPKSLHDLQNLHVLAGKFIRNFAHRYINRK